MVLHGDIQEPLDLYKEPAPLHRNVAVVLMDGRILHPLKQERSPLPFSDAEVTNLFNNGYSTFGDEKVYRLAGNRQDFIKIGEFIGSYRLDCVAGSEKTYSMYLVNSNETVVIRAHQPNDTHLNSVEPNVTQKTEDLFEIEQSVAPQREQR